MKKLVLKCSRLNFGELREKTKAKIFLMLLLLPNFVETEASSEDSAYFYAETNDIMFVDGLCGTTFMVSQSPLASHEGYAEIYTKRLECMVERMAPMRDDKNYELAWFVKDSALYLSDMRFLCRGEEESRDPERLKAIEGLTGRKFERLGIEAPNCRGEYSGALPLMPADWVSGAFYVKRVPDKGEFYLGKKYVEEPFWQITFKGGKMQKMLSVGKMPSPPKKKEGGVSEEISNGNPEARTEPANPKGFRGNTNDVIYINGFLSKNMCSESPAAPLAGYDRLMGKTAVCERRTMLPIKDDKPYEYIWLVHKDSLYLCDVRFICEPDAAMNDDAGRFAALEELAGKAMSYGEYEVFDKEGGLSAKRAGAIPATWYSGTLYVKAYQLPYEGYYGSRYEYAPFYRFVFEKGKAVERTTVEEMPQANNKE